MSIGNGSGVVKVGVEAQGRLLKLSVVDPGRKSRGGGGVKQSISSFSASSRRNMMRLLNRLDVTQGQSVVGFLCLTYPPEINACARCAKKHLRAFIRRLERYCEAQGERVGVIWRMEAHPGHGKARGQVHFHLLIWGPFIDKGVYAEWWSTVIGRGCSADARARALRHSTRIEGTPTKNHREVAAYVAKTRMAYVAKEGEEVLPEPGLPCSRCGLGTVSYWDKPGRFWGVVHREALPFAEVFCQLWASGSWFHRVKRLARRHWGGVRKGRGEGFTLYVDDIGSWLAWCTRLYVEEAGEVCVEDDVPEEEDGSGGALSDVDLQRLYDDGRLLPEVALACVASGRVKARLSHSGQAFDRLTRGY